MSDIPKEFTQEWYDSEYFVGDKGGKRFRSVDGKTQRWSYYGKDGEWTGCRPIVGAWKTIFKPKTLLDVGCGRGTFVAYARDIGIVANGFDYSKWAIENRYARCKLDWIWIGDVTKELSYPHTTYDLVTCLDLMEHIYEEDVDKVVNNLFSVAEKNIFLQIAVCGAKDKAEKPYSLKRDEPVPVELEGNAVAGHVHLETSQYWVEKFSQRDDWYVDYERENWFKSLVDPKIISNWLQNLILVVSKYD